MFASNTSQVSNGATYVEDVFSTYLYTGTGASQTITNNIDTTNYGGLVWIKGRSGATGHRFTDTARGTTKSLESNSTAAEVTESTGLTAFGTTGFTIGADADYNTNAATYTSWTFRKQAKFFDVVTYTGNGSNRTIAHNLGSVPGCIIIKRTDTAADWAVYHRNLANTDYLVLNSANASATSTTYWNSTTPTSAVFSLGTATNVNANGGTYVAYLFAHDAGGFGLTGTDNVISCGIASMPSSGSVTVNLGYEPQWVLLKEVNHLGGVWWMFDTMRGYASPNGNVNGAGGNSNALFAQSSGAENNYSSYGGLTSTGFVIPSNLNFNDNNTNFIYIAIRRGPMKTPTSGTSVFGLSARSGTNANATVTGSAGVSDAVLIKNRGSAVADMLATRLTGTNYLVTSDTAVEVAAGTTILQANPWDVMDGVKVGTTSTITNASSNTYINYLFDRASGFFDVVCYTGTGSARTVTHNLGVVPELIIAKRRDTAAASWYVYSAPTGNGNHLLLNSTSASTSGTVWNNTTPTSTVFSVGNNVINAYANIAYLFASCPGVSKVGSYTGNGSNQTINCGFTGGARFVMIKRTDSTGDWYVWDTARGIVALLDPHLSLNSTAAEVTTDDSIDTNSTGFVVNQDTATNINVSSASYIFLAIA